MSVLVHRLENAVQDQYVLSFFAGVQVTGDTACAVLARHGRAVRGARADDAVAHIADHTAGAAGTAGDDALGVRAAAAYGTAVQVARHRTGILAAGCYLSTLKIQAAHRTARHISEEAGIVACSGDVHVPDGEPGAVVMPAERVFRRADGAHRHACHVQIGPLEIPGAAVLLIRGKRLGKRFELGGGGNDVRLLLRARSGE